MPLPDGLVQRVVAARAAYTLPVQATRQAEEFTAAALALLFPHFAPARAASPAEVEAELTGLGNKVHPFLEAQGMPAAGKDRAWRAFLEGLGVLARGLELDARATADYDPAAHSVDEVLLAYPGFFALACYRIAHLLAAQGVELLP